jgi:hypothetical protein
MWAYIINVIYDQREMIDRSGSSPAPADDPGLSRGRAFRRQFLAGCRGRRPVARSARQGIDLSPGSF